MIVAGSTNPLLMTSAGGYNLTRSLRFRSSASAYLNRTPASAGNRKTWTWNCWAKLGALGTDDAMFSVYAGTTDYAYIRFSSDGTLRVRFVEGGSTVANLTTSSVYRDPSAWYMVTFVLDTTQATATDRMKLYVNGSQITSFSSRTDPSLNKNLDILNTFSHNIGRVGDGTAYFDGYLTEVNFIDGQALTPSSFGETNSKTGVWQPKRYAGTYGTNGFYLPFTDNSALTTSSNVGLGKDFSGNGNYWTTNNISITSGSTYDSMTDVPTLTSATAANYCVLNPLNSFASTDLSNANLQYSNATSGNRNTLGTIYVSSGKYYAEFTAVAGTNASRFAGIANTNFNAIGNTNYIGSDTNSYGYFNDGNKYTNSTGSAYGASWTSGDIIGVALDLDAGTLVFYKNGSSQGTAFTGISGTFTFGAMINNNGMIANFGQRPFAYTPPTGFVALNTYNLPTPTIGATASSQAGKYFNIALYSGNSANPRSISGVGLQPDFVWVKQRSSNGGGFGDHQLYDSVRGTQKLLRSNTTDAELANPSNGGVQSFDSDGFTIQGSSASINMNATGETYVAWNWRASNTTAVTNTAGSITSTVSANTTSGFSVVTYTGNGTAGATVGHGLGVAPSMILPKVTSRSGDAWHSYHSALGGTKGIILNNDSAATTDSGFWNNTNPTSSVFTVGTYNTFSSQTYVAYCFAEVAGFSKFGSYTGNGSTDGIFIYTGFRPKYVMVKRTDTGGDWRIQDGVRNPYNACNSGLWANLPNAENTTTGYDLDLVSNGFKYRNANADSNASGGSYIYMAFAESPFKYSLGR